MLIEQVIEFKLMGPGPPGRACTSTTGYFHDKTKSSRGSLFTVKILQEAMHLTSPHLNQIT